jgi:hypothetical protein
MAKKGEPVVLELASLPREQMGPFLILGVPKTADKLAIETHWADRVKWARRQLIKTPLEDINWGREMLNEIEKRIRADAASLNTDTADGVLLQMAQRYGLEGGQTTRMWQPLDEEKQLADYRPTAEVPQASTIRDTLQEPTIPEAIPYVPALLHQLAQQPLDPWALVPGPLAGASGS